MSSSWWRLFPLATIGALVAIAAGFWSPSSADATGPDISGNYDVNIQDSDFGASNCTASFHESGTDLDADLSCNTLGSGTLFGSYDKSGGMSLSGTIGTHQVTLAGSAENDFEMSGSCGISPPGGTCSFTGFRQILFVGGVTELPGVGSSGSGGSGAWSIAGAATLVLAALVAPVLLRRRREVRLRPSNVALRTPR